MECLVLLLLSLLLYVGRLAFYVIIRENRIHLGCVNTYWFTFVTTHKVHGCFMNSIDIVDTLEIFITLL